MWDLTGGSKAEVNAGSAIQHGHGGIFLLNYNPTRDCSVNSLASWMMKGVIRDILLLGI